MFHFRLFNERADPLPFRLGISSEIENHGSSGPQYLNHEWPDHRTAPTRPLKIVFKAGDPITLFCEPDIFANKYDTFLICDPAC
ncbi:hypothetical protein HDF11_005419 [Tunturiibacter psychrotolerans]